MVGKGDVFVLVRGGMRGVFFLGEDGSGTEETVSEPPPPFPLPPTKKKKREGEETEKWNKIPLPCFPKAGGTHGHWTMLKVRKYY